MRCLLPIALTGTLFAAVGLAQTLPPVTWESKLEFHAESAYGPESLAYSVAYAGYLQEMNSPREWGQGGIGYGKRFGSSLAYTGIRNVLGFGLDTALHEDPRYHRSDKTGFWLRTGHAFRSTFLSHKDSGGETFAVWRFGSAFGATFLSNEWYPARLNTVKLGLTQGSGQIGFDLLGNFGSEFWPDVKKKLLHHKP
jgi:hypothetical protein